MKLIFCGTPQFAVPTLLRLNRAPFHIELVLTNPDEPRGRGQALKPPPVKQAALDAGLVVFQPRKFKAPLTRDIVSHYRPDAIVVAAYGHIIPGWMIQLPRFGCINLHASLLPKYRGAAPVPWAIIRGENVTGVTTMKIGPGLDTGDILLQHQTEIGPEDTTETVLERLSIAGAGLMAETLHALSHGQIAPRPQDDSASTLAPMLKKEDGRIDWSLPAHEIERRVRGLRPWPGAYTSFRGKGLQIWRASVAAGLLQAEPGTLSARDGKALASCGQGTALELVEVQMEGRRRVPASDFLNGVRLEAGEKFDATPV
ncbi:MAG TPA: methionyl-tRNA formyltransferase [Terriglobia bacterium]|nr:methionyl-tRNA formyltransferase [Terriglobia bacterium]